MPLYIVRNDITKMEVDAIVNAANSSLLGGGGVDGCIHRAAGPELVKECALLGGCPTGSAKLTNAYELPCRYVIHAVGPVWRGGSRGEKELLTSCYTTALDIAKKKGCESIAFPLISSGIYGYPKDKALGVAVSAIGSFLAENDMTVYIVIYDKRSYQIGSELFSDIERFIDNNYVSLYEDRREECLRISYIREPKLYEAGAPAAAAPEAASLRSFGRDDSEDELCRDLSAAEASRSFGRGDSEEKLCGNLSVPEEKGILPEKGSLDDALKCIDESFSEMLLRKIDERGMTDAQCYKKANIDRKLFSKIRSDKNYKPSKPTAIAFAVALELPLKEAKEMLMKAGFALSHSNKFDIIIEYFIINGNYNVYEINEALFAFDQSLLG